METLALYSVAVVIGLVLLAWSSDRFVDGASGIAKSLGISPLIIGLTIVAFSTSAPEMLVSGLAAFQGNNGLAIGNVVGSNIANMTLVLGVTVLLAPLLVGPQTLNKDTPLLIIGMLFALGILLWDDVLSRLDGILLMAAMIFVIWLTIVSARKESAAKTNASNETTTKTEKVSKQIIWMLVSGVIILLISAKLLVWGAVGVAQIFGVSDLVIGLTIVAIGTSLPELAASVSAVKKGEHDMAVGNVIGSSLFNILAVLGIAGIVGPNTFSNEVIVRDYPIMLGLVVLFYLVTRFVPKGESFVIHRWVGAVLLISFFVYQGFILFGGSPS
ncbi:calcium/sodium antiporter [Leucothrix arctica]|uniref:Calcium/sodium antiporter n=1 Tax=Leucothrix arctica TaxID=1481894 RepID=A0A317C6X9_9GAMM|nr:calcium/sodium antiporter [Leucothrix arctica]PWQ93173.1 calcium/sodium antiporter [Leucothrix arctica]